MGSATAAGGAETTAGAGASSGIIGGAVSIGSLSPGEFSLCSGARIGRFGFTLLIVVLVRELPQ